MRNRHAQRRIENLLARGTLTAVNTARKMQRLNVKLLGGEQKQGVEYFDDYGFTSAPLAGAEVLSLFFDGDRSHGVCIRVADRRYRLAVAAGEVAMYDDLGRKVHFTRAGLVVDGASHLVTVKSLVKVRVEAPSLECTGEIKDLCDTAGKTMSSMRSNYNSHDHNPGPIPDPQM
jgi:phage baseplate assembly protein V